MQVSVAPVGFDISKYQNIDFVGQINILAIGVFQEVLNVTGKGFLSACIGASASTTLKVTIDDVVVYHGSGVGITTKDFTFYDSAAPTNTGLLNAQTTTYGGVASGGGVVQKHPYTSGGGSLVVLDIPLFFKKSLKIEMKNTATGNKNLSYKGGLKA